MMCRTSAANSLRPSEQLGERHRGGEALLRLFGQRQQHRRVEDAGRDRH